MGGVGSGYHSRVPYPLYISHGSGSKIWDVDNNEYLCSSPSPSLSFFSFCFLFSSPLLLLHSSSVHFYFVLISQHMWIYICALEHWLLDIQIHTLIKVISTPSHHTLPLFSNLLLRYYLFSFQQSSRVPRRES